MALLVPLSEGRCVATRKILLINVFGTESRVKYLQPRANKRLQWAAFCLPMMGQQVRAE